MTYEELKREDERQINAFKEIRAHLVACREIIDGVCPRETVNPTQKIFDETWIDGARRVQRSLRVVREVDDEPS